MEFSTKGIPEMGNFDILKPRDYVGKITKVEDKIPEGKTPYIELEITITEPDYANRKLWKRIYIIGADEEKTKKALGMFRGLQADLGLDKEERDSIENTKAFRDRVIELPVVIDVGIRNYEGKGFNEIKTIKLYDHLADTTNTTEENIPF